MRRVVVTGLGAITPLGVGVRRTWQRVLASECGIVSIADNGNNDLERSQWRELTSTVAGIVPTGPSSSSQLSTKPPTPEMGRDQDGLWRTSE